MTRPKLLMLSIIVLLASLAQAQSPAADCDKIEVTVETKNTTDGREDGSVKVNLSKGDKRSAKFIFCDQKGKVLNETEFKKQELLGLKKGRYILIVSTDDCSKKIDFNIE
jgi:hypothetical protein